ncbi:MAG: hypothetical protein IKS43_02780 [Clostridia bacterium]|nr:hypothetical protein [Clostridia bacterium]
MFGYITPFVPELKMRDNELYRAYYCGLCRALGRYGLGSKLSLTYDGAFAAALLTAAAGAEPEFERRSCAMHPTRGRVPTVKEGPVIDYCAAVCVLLAKYKLLDDARDGRPLRRALEPAIAGGCRRAARKYPETERVLKEGLARLGGIESAPECDADAAPLAFGEVLGGLFAACPNLADAQKSLLYELGRKLGGYIYITDAWDDLEEDRRRGGYNIFLRGGAEDPRATCEAMLDMYINSAVLAYDLLDLVSNKPLLDNIMYMGLAARASEVLRGEGKRKKDRLKTDGPAAAEGEANDGSL